MLSIFHHFLSKKNQVSLLLPERLHPVIILHLGSPHSGSRGPGLSAWTLCRARGEACVTDNRRANFRLMTAWDGEGLLFKGCPGSPRPTAALENQSAPSLAAASRELTVRACAISGLRRRARARLRGQSPALDDAAEQAAAPARSGGLKRRPAATGRRRDDLGGRPRLGAVRGSGPGVGGGGAAGGRRSSAAAAAAAAMRGPARPGPRGRGRLPGTRGLRAPPPPLLLLFALLPLLPAPGAASAPAPRSPMLSPAAAGPSVSLYLSEDEVRRLIGEWGRLRRGRQVGPDPGCFRRSAARPESGDRGQVASQHPGCLGAPAFACLAGQEVWSLPGPRTGSAFPPTPYVLAVPPRQTGNPPGSVFPAAS